MSFSGDVDEDINSRPVPLGRVMCVSKKKCRKPLAREDAERGHVTSIVRYEPGARFSEDPHPLGEEILVLAGTFFDQTGGYHAGTFFNPVPFPANLNSVSDSSVAACPGRCNRAFVHSPNRPRPRAGVLATDEVPLPGSVLGGPDPPERVIFPGAFSGGRAHRPSQLPVLPCSPACSRARAAAPRSPC